MLLEQKHRVLCDIAGEEKKLFSLNAMFLGGIFVYIGCINVLSMSLYINYNL
jgi:hypothetical protein